MSEGRILPATGGNGTSQQAGCSGDLQPTAGIRIQGSERVWLSALGTAVELYSWSVHIPSERDAIAEEPGKMS